MLKTNFIIFVGITLITTAIILGFSQELPLSTQTTETNTNYELQITETNQSFTNTNEINLKDLLLSTIREIPELFPTNLDYSIENTFSFEINTNIDESKNIEDEIDFYFRNIESKLSSYEENIVLDLLLEEEKSRREYQRLEKPVVAVDIEQLESRVFAKGNVLFGISYGTIKKLPDLTIPISSYIKENFNVNQDMRIYSTSKIGNKVNVDIEFDQKSAINRFNVSYKEPDTQSSTPTPQPTLSQPSTAQPTQTKPFVRELTFGDVSFSKTSSKYISYTAIAKTAQGIKFVGQRDNFYIEAIGTLATTIPTKKTFKGTKRISERTFKDIDFIKRKFFKLPDTNIDTSSLVLLVSVSLSEPADVYIDGIPFRKMIQGNEYTFDNFKSEIELKYTIDNTKFLAIFYTHHSGQPITFSTNIYKGIGSDNKEYLYLLNPTIGFSPYEIKNIYNLGTYDLNLSQNFEMVIYYTSDPTILAPFQFSSLDYYIDTTRGIIRFNSPTPFISNANYNIYSLPRDPLDTESTFSFKIRYYETLTSYQLDFDIVENSEEVRINGVLIPKDKYTIIYPIGRIIFKDPTLINEGDTVEISYEYKPFIGGSQKISLGVISEYNPLNFINLKLSTAFWTSQGGSTAPTIGTSTPETGIITSLINRIDFGNIFNIRSENFKNYIDMEYAISIVNPNSFGAAIINDFESNKKSILITKDEDSWYISSPSTNDGCFYTNRGKLYYKDYRQYYANESFTLMSYNWSIPSEQILPYSQKPGPYITSGGRLSLEDFPNVSQFSLVFDYDFLEGEWVGAMVSLNPAGIDLSDLSEIMISYKLQMDNDQDNNYDDNNTNTILLILQLGKFSEDIDGDGVLDTEYTTSQNGFDFNNPTNNSVITKVGSGRRGSGNGKIDSEDFNKNGKLDTEENFISFSNTINGNGWKQLVIPIQSLTSSQIDILRKTYSLRLLLKKVDGVKGRLLIDEIQFKFRTTPTYKVDKIIVSNPYQIKSTSISVYDSPLYLKNRFFNIEAKTPEEKERLQEYSFLHGTSALSISEAKSIDESSLRIIYNLSNTSINTNFQPYQGGKEGTVLINFNSSQNFSPYSKIVFYIFVPTKNELNEPIKQPGDTLSDENIVVRFVSKENNYFEFLIPMDKLKKDDWNRLEIRITENYKLIINSDIYNTITPIIVGFPSIRDITSMELGIKVNDNSVEPINAGEVWINEIFITDVNWYISSAINSSYLLSYNDDLKLLNFPIISNPYLTFSIENIFPKFKGTGGKENANILTFTHYYSSDLVKYIGINYSFSTIIENSISDPTIPEYLLYDNNIRTLRYSITTKHNINFLPSISYSFSDRQNSSSQNGLTTSGTNTFLQNLNLQEVGLDSTAIVSYTLPFVEKYFTLRNTLNLSSSYSAVNNKSTTNNIFYFVSPSYQNWIYSLSLDSFFNYSLVNINNSFKHSETFNITSSNIIDFVEYLSTTTIPERNKYSLNLLFEGFKERGNRKEIIESDTLTLSLINVLNTMNLYITPSYEFKDFNFNYISNSLYRDLQMNGKITYKLDFNINRLIFNSISINSSFETTLSANSINYDLKWYDFYTNNLYRGVVAIPIYEYSGLFGYDNLSNALVFVSNLYNVRSIVNEFTSSGISISLTPIDNLILSVIPRNYTFDYSTTTTRELSSFSQSTRMVLSTISYIPIYQLDWFIFRRTTNISVNDISLNLSLTKDDNFNTLITVYKISSSLYFSGVVSTQQNFSISYNLSYSYQDTISNLPSFYTNFGIGLTTPQSLLNLISHNLKLSYSFSMITENEIDLWITKIKANSLIENKEELNIFLENPWYNNNKFTSFKRKVFEINLYHETSINFSDFIKLSGYLKFLLGQMSEIYVENDEVKEKFFDVIPGIEVGINLKVTF